MPSATRSSGCCLLTYGPSLLCRRPRLMRGLAGECETKALQARHPAPEPRNGLQRSGSYGERGVPSERPGEQRTSGVGSKSELRGVRLQEDVRGNPRGGNSNRRQPRGRDARHLDSVRRRRSRPARRSASTCGRVGAASGHREANRHRRRAESSHTSITQVEERREAHALDQEAVQPDDRCRQQLRKQER